MGLANEIRTRLDAAESVDALIEDVKSRLTDDERVDYELYLIDAQPAAEVAVETDRDPEADGPLVWLDVSGSADVLIEGGSPRDCGRTPDDLR